MDVRGIVAHLCALSKDPRNRATIVKDQGCLPGLVLFLDHEDPAVVELAVLTLSFLVACDTNKPIMLSELGLVVSLTAIAVNLAYPPTVRDMASAVVQQLAPRNDPPAPPALQLPQLRKPMAEMQAGSAFFVGTVNKSARTLTLQVAGLDGAARRKLVEDTLLLIKGVVSFTFDMVLARVAVRARNEVSPESLCAAIAASKVMAAQQVVKDELGLDVLVSFGKAPAGAADAARTRPKYLDDEEAPIVDNAQTLARPGDAVTLGGWLSKGLGYISKSLYW